MRLLTSDIKKIVRFYVLLAAASAFAVSGCSSEKVKLDLTAGQGSLTTLYFYAETEPFHASAYRRTLLNEWQRLSEETDFQVAFFRSLTQPARLGRGLSAALVVSVKAASYDEMSLLQRELESFAFRQAFKRSSALNLLKAGFTEMNRAPFVSLHIEKRRPTFSRISFSNRKRMLNDEREDMLSDYPAALVDSYFIIGNGNTLRIAGFADSEALTSWSISEAYSASLRNIEKTSSVMLQRLSVESLDNGEVY